MNLNKSVASWSDDEVISPNVIQFGIFWHPTLLHCVPALPRVSLPAQNVVLESWSWLLDVVTADSTRPVGATNSSPIH